MVLSAFGKTNTCHPTLGAVLRTSVTETSPSSVTLPVRASGRCGQDEGQAYHDSCSRSEMPTPGFCTCRRSRAALLSQVGRKGTLAGWTQVSAAEVGKKASVPTRLATPAGCLCAAQRPNTALPADGSLFVSRTEEPFGREFTSKEESARRNWVQE